MMTQVRKLIVGLALPLITTTACVDMPREPEGPYIECANLEGLGGGVEIDGEQRCVGVNVEVTDRDTIYVQISFRDLDNETPRGGLTLLFEAPAQGLPSDVPLDAFIMGRYNSADGTAEIDSATMVVREDEIGALGTFELSATGATGNSIRFENGVYYGFPIERP